jgi:thioredoxin reductase
MNQPHEPTLDVVVVGGGPAGLSAALILGRCRRRVALFDSGQPRNQVSPELHGFLTRDGSEPADLRRVGREQLRRYATVEVHDVAVRDASTDGEGFEIALATGERLRARKLLLASGVKDELPEVEGFAELYGVSAFHCPYCDGWEWSERPLAVYGRGKMGQALALELLGWSCDLWLFTDGAADLSGEERDQLFRNGIRLSEAPVTRFEGTDGRLSAVHLADGDVIRREALFFAAPTNQSCALASGLGCDFNQRGAVRTSAYEKTNVPGLYVAGDASHHVELAIVAAAEGAMAAFAINSELLEEDRA